MLNFFLFAWYVCRHVQINPSCLSHRLLAGRCHGKYEIYFFSPRDLRVFIKGHDCLGQVPGRSFPHTNIPPMPFTPSLMKWEAKHDKLVFYYLINEGEKSQRRVHSSFLNCHQNFSPIFPLFLALYAFLLYTPLLLRTLCQSSPLPYPMFDK